MSRWTNAGIALLVTALTTASLDAVAAVPVDLELIIATDTSVSINDEEAALQRQGIAAAFKSEGLAKVIGLGTYGKIAVAYLDWSIERDNTVVIDWRIIDGRAAAAQFAGDLLDMPHRSGSSTSISSAIMSSMELFAQSPYKGTRRAIDISGDGANNFGPSLAPIREEALAKGIVINGLPIMIERDGYSLPQIDTYYATCVIGGRGSFAIVAKGFDDFARAVQHKLIMEIADIPPETQFADAGRALGRGTRLDFAEARELPPPPGVLRAPAVRETNCDVS